MTTKRGNNEGSIWKERNRYRTAVTVQGRRVTKSFVTKAECQSWIKKMNKLIDQGMTYKESTITLQKYMVEWLKIHKMRLDQRIGDRYEQLSRDFIWPTLGKVRLKDLRLEQIEALYHQLILDGSHPRNVRYVHSVLHRCLNDAVKRRVLGYNPSQGARLPKLVSKDMNILDESQVLQLLLAAQGNQLEALLHVAVKTGIRHGEILGLKWSDLDWRRGVLRVQRQVKRDREKGFVFAPPKTKSGRRSVQLGEQTISKLRKHLEKQAIEKALAGDLWHENGLIFANKVGNPMDSSMLLRRFKEILRDAGLPITRFHDLRHTAASLMLNHKVPVLVVSKMLGHSKPSTTLDIYGHMIPVMQEDAAKLMDELVTPISVDMGETKLKNLKETK